MTGAQVRQWRGRASMGRLKLAELLGLTIRQMVALEAEPGDISPGMERTILVLCKTQMAQRLGRGSEHAVRRMVAVALLSQLNSAVAAAGLSLDAKRSLPFVVARLAGAARDGLGLEPTPIGPQALAAALTAEAERAAAEAMAAVDAVAAVDAMADDPQIGGQ